jgi:hypothetical protein
VCDEVLITAVREQIYFINKTINIVDMRANSQLSRRDCPPINTLFCFTKSKTMREILIPEVKYGYFD